VDAAGLEVAYLAQHMLFDQIPSLQSDFEIPEYTECGGLEGVNAWLGTSGTVTPLHCDSYDNFLTQVVGFKYGDFNPMPYPTKQQGKFFCVSMAVLVVVVVVVVVFVVVRADSLRTQSGCTTASRPLFSTSTGPRMLPQTMFRRRETSAPSRSRTQTSKSETFAAL